MPVITVTLIEGYDEARRRDLAERPTDAAVSAIGTPVDGTTVVINEVPAANDMRGPYQPYPGHAVGGARAGRARLPRRHEAT